MNPTNEQRNIDVFNKVQSEQGTGRQFVQGQGIIPQSTVITGDMLSSTQSPLKLAPSQPDDIASGIINSVESTNTATKTQVNDAKLRSQELQDKKLELDASQNDLQAIFNETGQLGQEKNSLQNEFKIPEAKQQLDEITSQIEAKTLAARRRQEELDKNPRGLFGGALDDEKRRVAREDARELADLSIIQNARNRNLLTAQTLVNQKIELMTEDLKNRADSAKFFYTENKDSFTKAEEREFDALTKKADREYEETRDAVKTLEKTRLEAIITAQENGADNVTLRNIQQAATPEEAIMAMGKFGVNEMDKMLKQAQIDKMYAETTDKKKANGAISSVSSVDPNSPTYIQDIISASAGGATLTGEQTKPISKALTVVGQIDSLQSTLSNVDTGPIIGILKSANPYDVQAQLVKAQLQSIIPNLARGVYGEVGVLTDNDIANYRKTIGNLKSPKELNDLLLAMTLKTVQNGIDDQLEVAASAGRDVSGFSNLHKRLADRIGALNAKLGIVEETAVIEPTQADQDYINSLPL